MNTASYSVSTTRVLIVPADNINRTIYVHAIGNDVVYLGGVNVTAANGMLTEKGAVPFEMFLPANQTLYAVTASGTQEVRVMTPSTD
jgi:hypothetical protein